MLVILWQRACTPPPQIIDNSTFDTLIITDTIVYNDTTYIPKISYQVKIDTIIDTVEVIKEYYTKNYYQDTIINDTTAFVVIMDTVYKNEIISRKRIVQTFPTHIYTTSIVHDKCKPRLKLKVGFGIGGWQNKFGASGKLLIVTKKDHTYGISYDPINKYAEGSIYWTIKFGK